MKNGTDTQTNPNADIGYPASMDRRSALYNCFSDLYKDRNGIRPRFAAHWSVEELEAALDRLHAAYEADEADG